MSFSPLRVIAVLAAGGVLFAALGASPASAQFGPPLTVFGSVTDSEGEVPAGEPVTAYIGDTICSYTGDNPEFTPETFYAGEGESRVTMYVIYVVSAEQVAGCGTEGAEVRIKIGDRFADEITPWRQDLIQTDITFGNATPAPIPTTTPTPPGGGQTPGAGETPAAGDNGTPTDGDDGTPTDGETPGAAGSEGTPGNDGSSTALPGEVTTGDIDPLNSGDDDDGGGFPIWAMILVGLGVIAVAGGGIGFFMARNAASEPDSIDRTGF